MPGVGRVVWRLLSRLRLPAAPSPRCLRCVCSGRAAEEQPLPTVLAAGRLLSADPPVVTEDDLARVTCHQLWFAGMTKMRGPRSGVRLARQPPGQRRRPSVTRPKPLDSGQLQLHLPGAGRAFDRARHAEPTSPALVRARRIAQALGEGRGWNTKLAAELDRGW